MSETWVVLISLGFIVLLLAFCAVLGILFFAYLELKKTTSAIRLFLKNIEETVLPAFTEASATLRSIRNVSDDINQVTSNAKSISSLLQHIISNLRATTNIVEAVKTDASSYTKAFKTALSTALTVLIAQIFNKRR